LLGGGIPERILIVVFKVNLDPPGTGPGKMERHREEDTRLIAKQPKAQDEATNADVAIRGNVEDPPIRQRPPRCQAGYAGYGERGEPMGGQKKSNQQGNNNKTSPPPLFLE
jgi:hypothetical protein